MYADYYVKFLDYVRVSSEGSDFFPYKEVKTDVSKYQITKDEN